MAISTLFDRNGNFAFDPEEGQVVLVGGVDTATALPQVGSLIAPAGFFIGSPLSTLAANLVNEHGLTTEQALARVTEAFGLPAIDLRSFDTIAEATGGNLDASLVFSAEAMLQDTAAQIGRPGGQLGRCAAVDAVANLVYADLAAKIAPAASQLSLSNSFALEAAIGGVLDRTGLALDPNVVTAAAHVIGAANAHIGELPLVSGLSFLTEVVKTQVVAQGAAATSLAGLADGAATRRADGSARGLHRPVACQPNCRGAGGNIAPVGIHVGDARIVEGDSGDSLLEFTLSLDAVPATPVSISYATHDGTAKAGSDYLGAIGSLSWSAGDASTRTFQVSILGDELLESDERFYAQLLAAVGAVVRTGSGAGAIENDDPLDYPAPNDGVANEMTLEIDGVGFALGRNGATLFDGSYSANDPITVVGADGVSNSLAVEFAAVNPTDPGAAFPAPIVFTGGDGLDSLLIDNAASQFVVHYLLGAGAGRFEIDGVSLSYSGVESVDNRIAPTLTLPPFPLYEGGGDIVLYAAGANSEIAYLYSWIVTQGVNIVASGDTTEVRFSARDDGVYRVQFQTTAEGTGVGATIIDLLVGNVAPNFEAGGDETLLPPVAGAFSRAGISFTDPGADSWTATVDFGDGSGDLPLDIDLPTKTFSLDHVYTVSGLFDVTVTVRDDDGGESTDSFQLNVILNTPPVAWDDAVDLNEDGSIAFNVLGDNGQGPDADGEDNIVAAETVVDTLPERGVLTDLGSGNFTFDPASDFDYLAEGESTTETFTYRIVDAFGETDTATVTLTIVGRNDGPSVSIVNALVAIDEGDAAANSGSFDDVDLSDAVAISASAGVVTQTSGAAGSWSWSFDSSDGPNESQTITISATDSRGAVATTTFALVVNNVTPTLAGAFFEVVENSENGTIVGTTTGFDPGDDTLTYSIVGGTGAAAFAIDPVTGVIRVADASLLDFETTPRFTLQVVAEDEDGAVSEPAEVSIDLLNQASISGAVWVEREREWPFRQQRIGDRRGDHRPARRRWRDDRHDDHRRRLLPVR